MLQIVALVLPIWRKVTLPVSIEILNLSRFRAEKTSCNYAYLSQSNVFIHQNQLNIWGGEHKSMN